MRTEFCTHCEEDSGERRRYRCLLVTSFSSPSQQETSTGVHRLRQEDFRPRELESG
jgi:hypothetical protein